MSSGDTAGHGAPGPAGQPGRTEQAELAELAELRGRVAALEARGPHRPRHRARSGLAAVLIALAVVMAPLSVVAVWTSAVVGDTDRYVATVAPLASDPAVQAGVANRVSGLVVEHIDTAALLEQVAPDDRPKLRAALGRLDGPIDAALKSLVQNVTERFVSSPAFATLWTGLNRRAHGAVDKALTGGGGPLVLKGDAVTVDLAPVVEEVKRRLVAEGLTVAGKIPAVHTDFTVMSSEKLGTVKAGFRLLQILGNWMPAVTVLFAAAGVFLASRSRRALITTALAVAVSVGALGVGLSLLRPFYLDALPPSVSPAAAGSVYDTLVRFLRAAVRTVVTLGVLVAVGAWVSGPGPGAVRTRTVWRAGIGAVRSATGVRTGSAGSWVRRNKTRLNWGVVLLAALVFALWAHPTGMVTFWLALGVVGVLAAVEFLGPEDPAAAAAAAGAGGPARPRG